VIGIDRSDKKTAASDHRPMFRKELEEVLSKYKASGGPGVNCKLNLTAVRPNLLSMPATFGSRTDCRISCRDVVTRR